MMAPRTPTPSLQAGKASRALLVVLAAAIVLAGAELYALWHSGRVTVPATAPVAAPQPAKLPPETIGWVDEPTAEGVPGPTLTISGWALDPDGIRAVEIRGGGRTRAATIGLPRADVAQVKPGYPDGERSGFRFVGDFADLPPQRTPFSVVAINRNGRETLLATKSVVPPAALAQWRPLFEARGATAAPFQLVPATSAVKLGGASGLPGDYAAYLSPTFAVGVRVPILYLRTTKGAAQDWTFDPDWDIERRCGERRIAEDALGPVIAYATEHRLPVLFTLNGGVWADAGCDIPAWDVNDHLEEDAANCQWNEKNEVMPDDYFQRQPGAPPGPALGRMLTFNVYAANNRHYKRRNLEAAARIVAEFARAHPELFIGVNLDPDTYESPFFEEKQWYDYNPGTVRQFRHWLGGTGPYAGHGGTGVPDLRAYRRAKPLTLAQAGRLAGRTFRTWDDVDPPRTFPHEGRPFWEDPWMHEWDVFRRHLVDLHYDDLSTWTAAAGIPRERIFSSQGFMAPTPYVLPFSVYIDSPSKNYDIGGMSVQGAIPRDGHLGAILYGLSAINDARMEVPGSLFGTFRRMDPGWAVVEFNTADLREPKKLPTYAQGYRAMRDMFNYGARFASPMAWNGSHGRFSADPGFVSFTAWRGTPLEDAALDFAVSHAYVPRGARLWTFGTPRHADTDGWTVEAGGTFTAGNGQVDVRAAAGTARVVLVSPPEVGVKRGATDLLVLGVEAPDALVEIGVDARGADGRWVTLGAPQAAAGLARSSAGLHVALAWPRGPAMVEQVRVRLTLRDGNAALRLRHVALFPAPAR